MPLVAHPVPPSHIVHGRHDKFHLEERLGLEALDYNSFLQWKYMFPRFSFIRNLSPRKHSLALTATWLRRLCLLSKINSAVRIIGSHFSALQILAIVLAYLPTVLLVFVLLARQCCAKPGDFGRLRHISLRACWRKWHGLDIRDQQTAQLILDNMLSEAREPLLVTILLHEHWRCKWAHQPEHHFQHDWILVSTHFVAIS